MQNQEFEAADLYTSEATIQVGNFYQQVQHNYYFPAEEAKRGAFGLIELIPADKNLPTLYLMNIQKMIPGPIPGTQMPKIKTIQLKANSLEEAQAMAPRAQSLALKELEEECSQVSLLAPGNFQMPGDLKKLLGG